MMLEFQFESIADLLRMAGHGPYVWVAYAVGLLLMAWLVLLPLRQKKNFLKEQLVLQQKQQQREQQARQYSAAEEVS